MTILIGLLVAVLVLAYANGANDNFKAVATLYGSSALSYRWSLGLATAAQLAGSIASITLAATLLQAFGGKGLVPDATVAQPSFLLAVGLAGAATVGLATRLGMPVSTTHALIGALAGAGLALAPDEVAWSALGGRFALPLLLSPVLAVAAAAAIYPVARVTRLRLGIEARTCVCVAERHEPASVTTDGELVLARTGVALTADQAGECRSRYGGRVVGVSAQTVVDAAHVTSGLALGFARGLNDTPKVLALLVAASWSGLPPGWSLAIIAAAMAAGGLLHSRRLARTLSLRITEMNFGQGFIANIVGSGLVIGASLLGMGVSTTHCATGAIFGIGLWTGRAHWNVVGQIIAAWGLTLPVAMGLAWAVGVVG